MAAKPGRVVSETKQIMTDEEDSSISEEMEEGMDFRSLKIHVDRLSTRIRRKKENLEDFVSSMRRENSTNKVILRKLEEIEDDFQEGIKAKAELKYIQLKVKERYEEVGVKLERIGNSLDFINDKEQQVVEIKNKIAKHAEENNNDGKELSRSRNEVDIWFEEILARFRECKKMKISLSKSKPEDLIQSVKCLEKAAVVARELAGRMTDLEAQLQDKTRVIEEIEEELEEEKEKNKEVMDEVEQLANEVDREERSKTEQARLINAIRGLLDESEKLVGNLEAQNQDLNQIISEERKRVSDLRGKVSDLQERVDDERKKNRDFTLQFEHVKTEFLSERSQNEGYKRDMEMIKRELQAIKDIKYKTEKGEGETEEVPEESFEDIEEKLAMKDKLLEDKYIEVQRLESEMWKYTERIKDLEEETLWRAENNAMLMSKMQSKERGLEELTDTLKETQTALQSEKLVKDEYVIKCEILERRLSLMEEDLKDTAMKREKLEEEIDELKEKLHEEKEKSEESSALVEDLEEQLVAAEALEEYNEDIKTKSLENIAQTEHENEQLMAIVEALKDSLTEKDNGIEELIVRCAVEELRLREEIESLNNHVQFLKRDCVYKANIIERLRREVESLKRGLGTLNEEEEETESNILQVADLERELQEERIRSEKYEDALLTLNKQYEEADVMIREKDFELSRKSAEDGKRIAELLQEIEADKKRFSDSEKQIETLEEMLSLQEKIDQIESEMAEKDEQLQKDIEDMKQDYALKKLRRKDEKLMELKNVIDSLNEELLTEQKLLRSHEALITDLNDANMQDMKKIDILTSQIKGLEEQTIIYQQQIDELTVNVAEGQKLISELESVADKERMRAFALEELLSMDKKSYARHLQIVQELKKKVEDYQSNVGDLRRKVSRIKRHLYCRPSETSDDDCGGARERPGSVRRLQEKIASQKSFIRELKANVIAVEEKNEQLDEELQEQKNKNFEQDEKIDKLLNKSCECEDEIENMKDQLELIRERYHGLSGQVDEENIVVDEMTVATADKQESAPHASFILGIKKGEEEDKEKEEDNEGDDEQEDEESGESVYFECKNQPQQKKREANEEDVADAFAKERELIHQLLMFEQVFERIFTEERDRIGVVLSKFEGVIQKNTELVSMLHDLKQNLLEARIANDRKDKKIEDMEEHIEELLKQEDATAEKFMTETSEKEQHIRDLESKLEQRNETTEELKANLESRHETIESLTQTMRLDKNNFDIKEAHIQELECKLDKEQHTIKEIRKSLQEEQERTLQLSEVLRAEQARGVEMQKKASEKEQKIQDLESKLEQRNKAIEELKASLGSRQETIESLSQMMRLEKNNFALKEANIQELECRLDEEQHATEGIRKSLEEEEERTLQLSEVLTAEQVRGVEMQEKENQLRKRLVEEQNAITELNITLEEEMTQVNQLKESLTLEQLLKADYEKEGEKLKSKIMEEREATERSRQEHEIEKNVRYEMESKLQNVEENIYDKAKFIEELQTDIDTERKCYKIVSERLQAEQDRVNELEVYVKKSDEVSISDKAFLEQLKSTLCREEKQKSEYQCKLEKVDQEKQEKEHEIGSLMYQLGEERVSIENLLASIDLEKMAKSKIEVKLRELEEHISRDEQLFEELRENIDLETGRNRELAQLLDRERENNLELEDKLRELEKQVLLDLQLFDEFKTTIEQEREHNRELDELLNSGNYGGYNNRDSLLAELDGQLDELKSSLEAEKEKNHTLMVDIKKQEEDSAVRDLQELLKSEIMHAADLKQQLEEKCEKHRRLEEKSNDDKSKMSTLENTLKRVGELSVQVSKELEEELETIGLEFLDEEDAYVFDENGNYGHETEKDTLRLKALLTQELLVKKKLLAKTAEYQTQIQEMDLHVAELNIITQHDRCSLEEMKEEIDHKKRELRAKGNFIKEMETQLEEERKNAANLKRALEDEAWKLKEVISEGAVMESEMKRLSNIMEELETRIEELQIELERSGNEKKEREEESDNYKKFYEEEHKFAKERLELNKRLRQQLDEIEALNNNREEEISKLTKEKIDLLSKVEEVKESLKQRQATVENELEEKTKQLSLKESDALALQKIVEELSTIHMHKRRAGRPKQDKRDRSDDTKIVLKEIEDEFDCLDGELMQKDKEIDRLIYECRRAKADNAGNEKHILHLENEISGLKPLLKYHENHAKKAVSAMEKARLLCEILQTDAEMKDLKMSKMNNDVNELKIRIEEKEENMRKIEARHNDIEATLKDRIRELDNTRKGRPEEPTTAHSNLELEKESEYEKALSKDRILQIERLNARIIHMATVMQKVKDDNERTMVQKDNEIEKQGKAIAVMKRVYLGLKAELKRDDTVGEMRQLKIESVGNLDTVSDDAAFIIQDLEAQIKTLRNDVESRIEVVKGLRENLREMKKTKASVDRSKLRSKENVNRLLLIQLDEKKKKLKRLEKMHESMLMIYNVSTPVGIVGIEKDTAASLSSALTSTEEKIIAITPKEREEKANKMELDSVSEVKETLLGEDTKPNKTEIVPILESDISVSVNRESLESATPDIPDAQQGLLHEIPADVESSTYVTDTVEGRDSTSAPIKESKKYRADLPDMKVPVVRIAEESYLMALSANVGHYSSEQQESSKQGDKNTEQMQGKTKKSTQVEFGELPTSGWKVKLLVYIFIAAGLSVLPYYFKAKTLAAVLAFVVAPMFFALSAFEIRKYRKKAQDFLNVFGSKDSLHARLRKVIEKKQEYFLMIEEMKLQIESDQELIKDLTGQLREEIYSTPKEDYIGIDEVDVLQEQKQKIDILKSQLRSLEKSKLDEKERSKLSFSEYKKLRDEVERMRRKREQEDREAARLRKKGAENYLDADLRRINLSLRSLPVWIALAYFLYHVANLHPAAPYTVFLLGILYAANSWFTMSNLKRKLLGERKTAREQNDELDDMTELLEMEYDVIQSQKAAIDMMVREIDNEHVSQKAKRLTLAKMIWQMREMEEMRDALSEETQSKADDEVLRSAMKNIAEEKASEKLRMYSELAKKLPEFDRDYSEDEAPVEDLSDALKDLGAYAKAQGTGKEKIIKRHGEASLDHDFGLLELKSVAMIAINTIALVLALMCKSFIIAGLIVIQLLAHALHQRQHEKPFKASDSLRKRWENEAKRSKGYKEQVVKLKKLLEAEKSFKKSDEFAQIVKERIRQRAQRRNAENE